MNCPFGFLFSILKYGDKYIFYYTVSILTVTYFQLKFHISIKLENYDIGRYSISKSN